jgi:hypothetical protein
VEENLAPKFPAMTHFSNFWFSVSKLEIGPNVAKETTEAIGKALDRIAPSKKKK